MTLQVFTSLLGYPGPDRLDISAKGGCYQFAPTSSMEQITNLPVFVEQYTQTMRESYRQNKPFWDLVLASKRIVLVCHCQDPSTCHRTVLAKILCQVGVKTKRRVFLYGEITEWDATIEEPVFTGRRDDGTVSEG